MHKYQFTETSLKQLLKLPHHTQKRILKKLDYFCTYQNPLDFADHLTDNRIGQFRYRIGNYRVVFDVDKHTLTILTVGHRREIYKK